MLQLRMKQISYKWMKITHIESNISSTSCEKLLKSTKKRSFSSDRKPFKKSWKQSVNNYLLQTASEAQHKKQNRDALICISTVFHQHATIHLLTQNKDKWRVSKFLHCTTTFHFISTVSSVLQHYRKLITKTKQNTGTKLVKWSTKN